MTKVTLVDGTALDAIAVHSDSKFFGNRSRNVLTFLFPSGKSSFVKHFSEKNCAVIILGQDEWDDDGNRISEPYAWEGYTLFLSSGSGAIADIIIGSDDMTPCTYVRMAQLTEDEIRIKELEERLKALEA